MSSGTAPRPFSVDALAPSRSPLSYYDPATRLPALEEIQKANRLRRAIPFGLGERLKNAKVRELPNGLVDRGCGSLRHGSGNRCGDDGMRG